MEIQQIIEKHPSKVPIACINGEEITKFLASRYLTLNQFIFFYRRSKNIKQNNVIYVEIEGRQILGLNDSIEELYEKFKSDDDVLYVHISSEAYLGYRVNFN